MSMALLLILIPSLAYLFSYFICQFDWSLDLGAGDELEHRADEEQCPA
jgi:hypothetical protein